VSWHWPGWQHGPRLPACEWRRSLRAGDGNAALELVVLVPVLLGLLGLVVAAGRTSLAQGSVDAAARDAARQASIALTPSAAVSAGAASAVAALRRDGLDCRPVVRIDTAEFRTVPPGQPAMVWATVACTVPLASLALPGLPGSHTMLARFGSPLDIYRSRALTRRIRRVAEVVDRLRASAARSTPARSLGHQRTAVRCGREP
jgi:Flp pilus assembly protein TadG